MASDNKLLRLRKITQPEMENLEKSKSSRRGRVKLEDSPARASAKEGFRKKSGSKERPVIPGTSSITKEIPPHLAIEQFIRELHSHGSSNKPSSSSNEVHALPDHDPSGSLAGVIATRKALELSNLSMRTLSSSDTTSLENLRPNSKRGWPLSSLRMGELNPTECSYVPLKVMMRYPYTFCPKDRQSEIVGKFFDEGNFWLRNWHMFYVWPATEESKPVVLLTEPQVVEFLDGINREIPQVNLTLTPFYGLGLTVTFPKHPQLQPRFLGTPHSPDERTSLEESVPGSFYTAPGESTHPAPNTQSLKEFAKVVEDAQDLQKRNNKVRRLKKANERVVLQKRLLQQLRRSQRYLGLRPRQALAICTATPTEQHSNKGLGLLAPAALPPINLEDPAPHPFDLDAIFVCVDVESFERDHSKITEVGICTLDVRDLNGVSPGEIGANWVTKLRTRHFRISEHTHLRNVEFIQGCPERFGFGESEFIRLADAPAIVASCFRFPSTSTGTILEEEDENAGHMNDPKRNIIFVGHDVQQDVLYLKKLGYNVYNLSNLVDVLDTASMFRAWKREQNSRSLNTVLNEFGIIGWSLHNAGNDANYTMQALLAMTVKGAQEAESNKTEEGAAPPFSQGSESTSDPLKDIAEQMNGWSLDEADDGGPPSFDRPREEYLWRRVSSTPAVEH